MALTDGGDRGCRQLHYKDIRLLYFLVRLLFYFSRLPILFTRLLFY